MEDVECLSSETNRNGGSNVMFIDKESVVDIKHDQVQRHDQDLYSVKAWKEQLGKHPSNTCYSWSQEELPLCRVEFGIENYTRGCKWSPDGQMLLVNSNDNCLRLFPLPDSDFQLQQSDQKFRNRLKVKENDLVYDFAWYPVMNSSSPETCMFATTCRGTPIHLCSAVTGAIVCSYRPINHLDENVAAHSIGFTSDGRYLVSGFAHSLRCFATDRPGRDFCLFSTIVAEKDVFGRKMPLSGQRGILSCFAAHPSNPTLVAAGAFNGDVAIYQVGQACAMTTMFEGQIGGVTHLVFSKDGHYLFTGGRKDPEITCFDIRMPERVLYGMFRDVVTNQRMYFDLDQQDSYLLSGNDNGTVSIWDLKQSTITSPLSPWPYMEPVAAFTAHNDAVNGCCINPEFPFMATCSGQRHFSIALLEEDRKDEESHFFPMEDNSVKLWKLKLPL